MTFPDELRDAICAAEDGLAVHAHGALELAYRQRLWAALGPRQAFAVGHRRRTRLAICCVRRVLPEWEKLRPEDDWPQRLLQSAADYLVGNLDRKAARALVGEGSTHSYNVNYQGWKAKDHRMQAVGLICGAAAKALSWATGDDKPHPVQVDGSLTDRMLDPYQWDTSYEVSLFVAHRHPGMAGEDVGRRRAFWEWYLREAVPMAWEIAKGAVHRLTGRGCR